MNNKLNRIKNILIYLNNNTTVSGSRNKNDLPIWGESIEFVYYCNRKQKNNNYNKNAYENIYKHIYDKFC